MIAFMFAFILQANSASALQINIEFTGTVPSEARLKMLRVRDRVEQVVSLDAFRSKALEYQYTCFSSSNLPNGVSTVPEAVDFIQNAQAQIEISFFYERSSTRAATGAQHVAFNTYYFNSDEEATIANTLLHETLHTLDFGHCGLNNVRWHKKILRSIPYRFGDFAESLY